MNYVDIDECLESLDNCDVNYGNCNNTIGSFTCTCVSGFSGDGTNCSSKTYIFSHNFNFTFLISQILMSARLTLTTVIQMPHALTLRVALSVCVVQGSLEME